MKTLTRLAIVLLLLLAPAAWAQTFTLGTTNLLEGPAAGSDSVVLVAGGAWTATTNATWLHLSADNQSGTVSTNVIFTFDANPGATRTGTLTIAGQTLTITQAGSTYAAVTNTATLVSSGLNPPLAVAVDSAGNVYIADYGNNAIKKWTAARNTITTLVSSGLSHPNGVAVDGAGNVYIADTGNNAIKEWTVANSNVTTLVSSGLSVPRGVAVDGAGNVYIADTGNNAIEEWTVANSNITTLVSSGLSVPRGVAVDGLGNVYIADTFNNAIKEWIAASNTVTILVSSGLSHPYGVAVDGSGNVYIADVLNSAIKKWTAASNTVTTLVSLGLNQPSGVAVDGVGNVYISGSGIIELPHAFVDATAKTETGAAGSDVLPVVLPVTANLTGPFAPASDSPWLTIKGIINGVVSFGFTSNYSSNRTGHITLLSQNIAVTQMTAYSLGTTNLLEGPAAGSDSVVLAAGSSWTATTNASWLHLSAANQSGATSTNVIFTFDANPGATRTGTLTIAGIMLTITQAGSTYVATTNATTLCTGANCPSFNSPTSVAVDGSGNVYIANAGGAVNEWILTNNNLITLYGGLNQFYALALDGIGNVFLADIQTDAIEKLNLVNSNFTTVVSIGPDWSEGVAVDPAGNVYIAGIASETIKKWNPANSNLTTLVSSGLYNPKGMTIDAAGNVYFVDSGHYAIKKWNPADGNVSTPIWGILGLRTVAVDGSGNVFYDGDGITKWTAANSNQTRIVSNNGRVGVDGAGNVYFTTYNNNSRIFGINELPHAFVDATAKTEPAIGGSDTLPMVLPATANLTGPFAPTSDSEWLTISGCTNGVVSFAFTANYFTTNRAGNITVLGQSIPVTQPSIATPVLSDCKVMGNGSLQFCFTNNQGASFTVWTSTNMLLPFTNWTALGPLTNDGSGQYQFNDPSATNSGQRFYRVSSP